MKARIRVLKEDRYFCENCDQWFDGEPNENEVLRPDDLPEDGIDPDDAHHYAVTLIRCDDVPPCEYPEVIQRYSGDELWECGSCGDMFEDSDEAAGCCT